VLSSSRLFFSVDYKNQKLFPVVILSMLFAVFVNQFRDSGGPKIAIFDKISINPWKFGTSASSRFIIHVVTRF
jgi:hypothetical protein